MAAATGAVGLGDDLDELMTRINQGAQGRQTELTAAGKEDA